MMTFQVEQVLETMPEEIKGFTIVWDTRNTGMKVGGVGVRRCRCEIVREGRKGLKLGHRRITTVNRCTHINIHIYIHPSHTTEQRQ
jgi:hypothetical protein